MDEIFNLLHSPAFWFTNLVTVVPAIVANRLDKQIPPLSIIWLEVLIYCYSVFGIAATLHAFLVGGYFPDDFPYEAMRYNAFKSIIASFVMPMFVIFFTRRNGIAKANYHKKAILSIGATVVISLAYALCVIVINKGWTPYTYRLFLFSTHLMVLTISTVFFIGLAIKAQFKEFFSDPQIER